MAGNCVVRVGSTTNTIDLGTASEKLSEIETSLKDIRSTIDASSSATELANAVEKQVSLYSDLNKISTTLEKSTYGITGSEDLTKLLTKVTEIKEQYVSNLDTLGSKIAKNVNLEGELSLISRSTTESALITEKAKVVTSSIDDFRNIVKIGSAEEAAVAIDKSSSALKRLESLSEEANATKIEDTIRTLQESKLNAAQKENDLLSTMALRAERESGVSAEVSKTLVKEKTVQQAAKDSAISKIELVKAKAGEVATRTGEAVLEKGKAAFKLATGRKAIAAYLLGGAIIGGALYLGNNKVAQKTTPEGKTTPTGTEVTGFCKYITDATTQKACMECNGGTITGTPTADQLATLSTCVTQKGGSASEVTSAAQRQLYSGGQATGQNDVCSVWSTEGEITSDQLVKCQECEKTLGLTVTDYNTITSSSKKNLKACISGETTPSGTTKCTGLSGTDLTYCQACEKAGFTTTSDISLCMACKKTTELTADQQTKCLTCIQAGGGDLTSAELTTCLKAETETSDGGGTTTTKCTGLTGDSLTYCQACEAAGFTETSDISLCMACKAESNLTDAQKTKCITCLKSGGGSMSETELVSCLGLTSTTGGTTTTGTKTTTTSDEEGAITSDVGSGTYPCDNSALATETQAACKECYTTGITSEDLITCVKEKLATSAATTTPAVTLQKYAPLIALGVVLTGVAVYSTKGTLWGKKSAVPPKAPVKKTR